MSPSALVQQLQPWFRWAPPWVFSMLVMAVALLLALIAYEGVVRLVRHGFRSSNEFWRALIVRTRAPGRMALVLMTLSGAIAVAPLRGGPAAMAQHALLVAGIILVGWTVLTATDIASALYMRRYRLDVSDNLTARKHLTQVRILRRAMAMLVLVITAALALMTIPQVRQWGVSLLAAGGAAGILVGLALQPLLSNLMAGIQIATTQPIRMDDQVVVENEFGNVEEITATYVIVRLWDERRMVLPLTYFLQKPFQNWTRETSQMTGTVMLYVDYTTPMAPLRAKLKEIVEASPLWDRRAMALQVTDARERTVEVRCLVTAADAGRLFDLRCEVREKMIAFLQAEAPQALPRERLQVAPDDVLQRVRGDGADRAVAQPQ
jgi:small-conductance mechanosensitive channel